MLRLLRQEKILLRTYEWPGNIRELKNVIERCILLKKTPGECISGADSSQPKSSQQGSQVRLDEVEKNHILSVLEMEGGNKSAAARLLGVSRKTLERKVKAWTEEGSVEAATDGS